MMYSLLNPNRGTADEKVKFHRRLDTLIGLCCTELADEETSGLKRTREDDDYNYGEDGTKNDEKGDEKDSETVVPPTAAKIWAVSIAAANVPSPLRRPAKF